MSMKPTVLGLLLAVLSWPSCPKPQAAIIIKASGDKATATNIDLPKDNRFLWLVMSLWPPSTSTLPPKNVSVGCFSEEIPDPADSTKTIRVYTQPFSCKKPSASVTSRWGFEYIDCELKCTDAALYRYWVLIDGTPVLDPEIRVKGGSGGKGWKQQSPGAPIPCPQVPTPPNCPAVP